MDDGVEFELCPVIVFQFYAAQHPVEPEVLCRRFITERPVVVGNRLLVFLFPDAAESAQLIDAGDIRIEVDGLRAVVLCPGEIVKIIFRHSPVKPRLIQIGF